MPKLAVQILSYKSSNHIAPLLEALKAQTFRDFDVWVYDNSEDSEDATKTQALVETSGLSAHFFVAEKNSGFAGGHEMLFRMHNTPFVFLLNDDAKLEPAYLEQVVRRIESDPKTGSVTGLIYRWIGGVDRIIDTAGLEYKCLAQIVDRWAGEYRVSSIEYQAEEVFGVSGAVGLYRRSAVEAAGGLFDPTWFMYKEDADLALRLRRAGYTAWFEPEAVAYHRRGVKEEGKGLLARLQSERRRPAVLRRSSYVNQWRIYRRHFRWSLGIRDIARTCVVEFLRSAGVFVTSPQVFFQAWYDIILP